MQSATKAGVGASAEVERRSAAKLRCWLVVGSAASGVRSGEAVVLFFCLIEPFWDFGGKVSDIGLKSLCRAVPAP